jgi:hypothetical protein
MMQNIVISYPVELSKISSQKAISFSEEAPLAIALKNKSSLPIGYKHKRLLYVTINYDYGEKDIIWIPKDQVFETKLNS